MKLLLSALLVLLVVVAVSATATHSHSHTDTLATAFAQWMKTHSKVYSGIEETQQRFTTWKHNHATVSNHNLAASRGEFSFRLGMTKWADLTNTEYRATLSLSRKQTAGAFADGTFTGRVGKQLPASVDWRTHTPAVVTPVKDQGQCGSCWAFSAVGAMEGAHALATGTLLSLSEQELVDCVDGGADNCTAGGEMHDGYLYAISAGGMELETDYPYTASSGGACEFDRTKAKATFSSYLNVTSGDESALAQAINTQPTISVGIDASSIWFQLYSSGVYDDSSCKSDWADLDHGVLVVGYGTDSASGKNYWIVKNSWNALWGNQGYIWMVKDKQNQCGIATDATFPLV